MMKPALFDPDFTAKYAAWKADGAWTPASAGTETPFTTRTGATLLYCYQARTGKHAYLDCGTDLILTDVETRNLLGDV